MSPGRRGATVQEPTLGSTQGGLLVVSPLTLEAKADGRRILTWDTRLSESRASCPGEQLEAGAEAGKGLCKHWLDKWVCVLIR